MPYPNRNKNILLLLVLAMLGRLDLPGQTTATFGDQSPVLRGVNNSVRYFNNERISGKVPDAVIPLLAGVLIVNKADPASAQFQRAVNAWLEKYAVLAQKIEKMSDPILKSTAARLLAGGNFPEVENLLREKSRYDELVAFFPASYQTAGAQSPILVGDNSTVTYVVNKIIEYKLPESLTQNLLDRLYAQDKKINALSVRIADREQTLESWIAQYRALELQLRDSPDSLNRAAWRYFHQGKLDSALLEINKAQSAAASLGRISFLKARIQILQFDYANYDRSFTEIHKNLQIAALLESGSPEIQYQYALFFVEFSADNVKRIEVLENAYKAIPADSLAMKFQIALQLADAYINLQRNLTAEQYLQSVRRLINAEKSDTLRAESLFLTQLAFSRLYGYSGKSDQALAHCDSALAIARDFPSIQTRYKKLWYVIRLNRISAAQLGAPATLVAGLAAYDGLLVEAESNLEKSAGNDLFLADRYSFLAGQYLVSGNLPAAKATLLKNEALLRPYINPKGQLYFQFYFNNWLQLLNVLSSNADYAEWGLALQSMDTLLTRWSDAGDFSISKSRLDFEYGTFLAAHKKYEAAIDRFRKSLAFLLQALPSNPEGFAFHTAKCIDNIGSCYATLYKPGEGIAYLRSQLAGIDRIQSLDDKNYTFAKIKIYRQIGNLYQVNGQMDSARIQMQTGLREAETRLSASNDAFLYDFISLSLDYAASYLNIDNARAVAIAENAKNKINHYTAINPYMRQKYLPDLAHTTAYTAHIHALSRALQQADQAYAEAYRLYSEMTQPTIQARYMFANFMLMYCDFLHNTDYLFPKLSKKERNDLAARKCLYAAEGLEQWKNLPDDYNKVDVMKRLNTFLQTCRQ